VDFGTSGHLREHDDACFVGFFLDALGFEIPGGTIDSTNREPSKAALAYAPAG
jgi:hypothetical protein